MREIKFRGKAKMSIEELNKLGLKHENGWVVGNLVMYGKTPYIVGDFIEVDAEYTVNEFWVEVIPDTVGQFSGLKDMNGRDIYEGDIVECFVNGNSYVSFKGGVYGLIYDYSFIPFSDIHGEMKVIGNIYENKHLLEEVNNESK